MKSKKNTAGYRRFKLFLDRVKSASSDLEILKAGYDLIESYRGFRYQHISISTENIIQELNKDLEHETKQQQFY